jgi:hypothetical protein
LIIGKRSSEEAWRHMFYLKLDSVPGQDGSYSAYAEVGLPDDLTTQGTMTCARSMSIVGP